jgi:hypothetical protein
VDKKKLFLGEAGKDEYFSELSMLTRALIAPRHFGFSDSSWNCSISRKQYPKR